MAAHKAKYYYLAHCYVILTLAVFRMIS